MVRIMGVVDLLLDKIFDDKWVGYYGEKLTERELKLVKLFGRSGKTLRNVYLSKDDGATTEIDILFITQKGIFVFESKNYSGWIFGDEKSSKWTMMLPNKEKNQFYNPILQNKTHIKWLKSFVGEEIPMFSIIVFSERCELKKITVESKEIKVIKRDRTYATVREIWEESPDVLDENAINELYVKLEKQTKVDKTVKEEHIKNIQEKYQEEPKESAPKKEVSKEETPQNEVLNEEFSCVEEIKICPKCGSRMILRTAKKGENAGNQFFGCSSFPKCRYIENTN